MATNKKLNRITVTDLQGALQSNLPNLKQDKPYLLQELVGDALWNSIPTGTRKQLGHQFKALVDSGDQEVTWRDRRSNNCQVYQLK
jgi:hypothetical protein